MQATVVDAPFDDPGYLFEPWWPGARAIAFCERGGLRLQVAGMADALAAFPELTRMPEQLRDGVVIDGAPRRDDAGSPDRSCCAPAWRAMGSREGSLRGRDLCGAASDVVARSFGVRRRWLEAIRRRRRELGRGYIGDGTLVAGPELLGSMALGRAPQCEAPGRPPATHGCAPH